jgi:hypothetical protein
MVQHRISRAKLTEIQLLLAGAYSDRDIWRTTSVARSTIRRIRLSIEFFSTPYPPLEEGIGRLRALSPSLEDVRISKLFDTSYS